MPRIFGRYKKLIRLAPADLELLINVVGPKIVKRIPDFEHLFQFKREWQ